MKETVRFSPVSRSSETDHLTPSPRFLPRRQAGSMLRGSLLAGLAGTATVCAGLVYLRPGQGVPGHASADAPGRDQPVDAEEEPKVDASSETSPPGGEGETETSRGEVGEERLSRVRRYRDGVRRWLGTVTPSTRNLVRA